MNEIIAQQRLNEILGRFSTLAPILVLGDVGIDKYTFGNVERISPEAPVPVLQVTKEWKTLGLAANIINNFSTLEVVSSICGVIGRGEKGDEFISMLKEKNISTDFVLRSDRPTIYKERILTSTQQICRVDYESTAELVGSEQQLLLQKVEDKIDQFGALLLEDYAKGTVTEKVAQQSIEMFKEQGKMVTVDPARNIPPHFYRGATLLKPNQVEAISMVKFLGYKESDPAKIAEILCDKLNIEKILITLGGEGMAIFDRKDRSPMQFIPTMAREVYDVSGAGDTVIRVLTAALLAGATLLEAAWIGNAAAGVVVAKRGTATVSLEELAASVEY
jgi:rfaE bifunctional protein kinase chain/domain